MNKRIEEFRNALGLSQPKLGEILGVTRSSVCGWENGRRNISESVIKTILLQSWNGKYVSENWLRYGEGEMFRELPPHDEVAAVITHVLDDIGCENSMYTFVKEMLLVYESLDTPSKKALESYIDKVIERMHEKREEK